jgi:hypothetical protein
MTLNWGDLKSHFENLIRAGQLANVRKEFKKLPLHSIPREHRATFANLARRARIPRTAIRILKAVVHSDNPLQSPATPIEIASYTMALASLGTLNEARSLVSRIADFDIPETLLACAYVYIWGWDYRAAIPFLKRYLNTKGPSEYQMYVAKLNLVGAYNYLNWHKKENSLVNDLVDISMARNWHLIHRDSLILRAQKLIADKNWRDAQQVVNQTFAITHAQKLDDLIVRKWQVFLELERDGAGEGTLAKLKDLKSTAHAAGRAEVVRDCDYFLAKQRRDLNGVSHVYFGTPFASFRKRIQRETADFWEPQEFYLWLPLGPGSANVPQRTIDLRPGRLKFAQSSDLRFRLLSTLSSDFFRPFSIGSLFTEIYPLEAYDSHHSPAQTFDVIRRLREWLVELDFPIQVDCHKHQYRLRFTEPVGVVVDGNPAVTPSKKKEVQNLISQLRSVWPYRSFSTHAAAQVLKLPDRKVRSLLAEANQNGLLYQDGMSRSRLYRFRK